MRRLGALFLGIVALLLLAPASAGADSYEPTDPEVLEAQGWETYTTGGRLFDLGEESTRWCKSVTDLTDADRETFGVDQEPVQEAIHGVVSLVKSSEELNRTYLDREQFQEDSDYAMLCVDPEKLSPGEDFFCVRSHYDLPLSEGIENQCWDSQGEYNKSAFEKFRDVATNPVGSAVESTFGQWATELNHGVRSFFAKVLYWWIMLPHIDLEESGAGVMWPPMLGLGMGLGIVLLAWQGIKMMFSSKSAALLVETFKGLIYFAIWCIAGIAMITVFSHATEALTAGIFRYAVEESSMGCSIYQATERQPDGLELEFPDVPVSNDSDEGEGPTKSEIGQAFGSCAAAQLAVGAGASAWIMLFYIIAFIMSLIQALLLFIREAALPVMALLLPIAAAGQIGGSTTQRWLPNLLTMMITMLLYKPMIALIFAVGFTSATLGDDILDVLRGLLTILIGVVAPGIMLKAFKPIATQGIEDAASLGSTVNNMFMATQMGGSMNQWAEKRAAARAAETAKNNAAHQAAHQGGGLAMTATKKGAAQAAGTAAAAASGPVGWVAKAGQAIKGAAKFVAGKSEGPAAGQATHAAQAGRQQAVPHPQQSTGQGQAGHPGLQTRESRMGTQDRPPMPQNLPMSRLGAQEGLPEPYGTMPAPDPGPAPHGSGGEPPMAPPGPTSGSGPGLPPPTTESPTSSSAAGRPLPETPPNLPPPGSDQNSTEDR